MDAWAALALTVFVWWFATGAILFLDGLPRRTFRLTIGITTAVAGIAFAVLATSASGTDAADAYVAFLCAIAIWGWNEVAFLMGGVTGPRRSACPPEAAGWRRFVLALQTLLYHEALILACGVVIAAVTWGAPNKVGLWTFGVLWAMRASAKLNIFLGVPNITHEFLPAHLAYLKGYFRFSPASALLPISIGAGTLAVVILGMAARNAPPSGFEEAACVLLSSLTALAVIEHLFMVVPLPSSTLWAWAMRVDHGTVPASVASVSEARATPRAGGDR